MNARMLIARIKTRASRTRLRTSTQSTPITRLRPAIFAVTSTPPVHEHTYSDWTADGETGHYRVCTDENCTSADKGRVTEAHVYTDDADTTAAEFSDGSDVAVAHIYTDDADMSCHVCGYKRTGTPPAPTEFTITSDSNGGYNPPATP